MLKLEQINKVYTVDEELKVTALKNINLDFEKTGFVCILGQSGCGKTTLLNILGGLDKYTSGDLIINNQSTKEYKDSDWDNYRNKEIGIVFQAYNLIPHISVLGNVELAMTLSGVSKKEREERAKEALISVGLEKEINKKPNQLSGGQMQRVALARALVNKPNIILADEPTGALDSNTSIQVMDLLKEISKTKLVITVTHNEDLAKKYASRIIRLKDGEVLTDDHFELEEIVEENNVDEIKEEAKEETKEKTIETKEIDNSNNAKSKKKHTSMSMSTALGISGKNLLTKKGKTIIISVAASFGIIGVGLVLALSNGFSNYVSRMETETLTKFPLSIEKYSLESTEEEQEVYPAYPSDSIIHITEPSSSKYHQNKIDKDYVTYLENIDKNQSTIRYNYSVGMNVLSAYQAEDNTWTYKKVNTTETSFVSSVTSSITGSSTGWKELYADKKTILDTYDIVYQAPNTSYPSEDEIDSYNEKIDQKEFGLVLVIGTKNTLSTTLMDMLGLDSTANKQYTFEEFAKNMVYKYVMPDDYYQDEQVIEKKSGFFFKEGVTATNLMDALTNAANNSNTVVALKDYFDLPAKEQMNDTMIPAFTDVISNNKTELEKYVDTAGLTLLMGKVIMNSDATITNGDISKILKDSVKKDKDPNYLANREEFSALIYKCINEFLSHEKMTGYTNKEIKTYLEPSSNEQYGKLYNSANCRTLKITTILRAKESTSLGILASGIYYPKSLTYQALSDFGSSKVAKEFKNHILLETNDNLKTTTNTILSKMLDAEDQNQNVKDMNLLADVSATKSGLGISTYKVTRMSNNDLALEKYTTVDKYLTDRQFYASDVSDTIKFTGKINPLDYADFVSSITIYAKDYDSKNYVMSYLNAYNDKEEIKNNSSRKIYFTDVGGLATNTVGQIVSVISAVLISFASISLVVSSIMIAIIIYTSVIERTKEIGVLRSIGARKVDVGRLFKAEAMIIGFLSGLIGVVFTYLISLPISGILNIMFKDIHLGQIAFLHPMHAVLLILLSTLLTYLASLIPARIASKKDPVTCLRSE